MRQPGTGMPQAPVGSGLHPAALAVLLLASGLARGQQLKVDDATPASGAHLVPTLAADLVGSSNFRLGNADAATPDVALRLTPALRLDIKDPAWTLRGTVGVTAVHYLAHPSEDKLLPQVDIALRNRLADRWLYVDSKAAVSSDKGSPFQGSSLTGGGNRQTSSSARIAPTLDHDLDASTRIFGRSDNAWTRQSLDGRTVAISTNRRDELWYDTKPKPMGLRVEGNRLDSRNQDLPDPVLQDTTLRVIGSYAVDPQFIVNLRGGHERAVYETNIGSSTVHGAGLRWEPSARSQIDAWGERHFYGNLWQFTANTRGAGMTASFSSGREVGTYADSLGRLGAGGSVADMIDQLLLTRFPDPAQRSAAVQEIINNRGLPATLTQAVELFSSRAELRTANTLTFGLLGVRHLVTIRLYNQRIEDLPGEHLTAAVSGAAKQAGWALNLNRRLDPQTAADLSVAHDRTVGLDKNLGQVANETRYTAGVVHQVNPRTLVNAGARRMVMNSTVVGSVNENSLYVGLVHRF
jgi:uncharacterized protein (PEP-CTERM system associated)